MTALISKNAETILNARYLSNGESIDGMFRRVSLGNENYYDLMKRLVFLPNSPTLFNAGLKNGCTLAACFVFDVEDSMFGKGSIVQTREKAIAVAKAGGGVGYYFGNIRPKGSLIRSVHRKACGPVAVMRDYHGVRQLVTQGGKRDLAQMGVLDVAHPDVAEFIDCKTADPKALESFNISVSWTDDHINKIEWDLIGNGSQIIETNGPTDLWWRQCEAAWKTGDPGMLFHDTINRANVNPHLGTIHATNPCGEVPNRTDEPCSLGSMALSRYVDLVSREFDWSRFTDDVCLALEFMDDILEVNEFPHPDITAAALLTRRLGLGVMGWADTLALMGIQYDTDEALALADRVMSRLSENARATSRRLASVLGPYSGFCADRTRAASARNETVTSIAPTGTISIIADVSSGVEPYFAFDAERTTNEGFKMRDGVPDWVRPHLNGFVPKTAQEIAPEWHVRMQAAFQRHTDLGVSKTVNLPNSATVKDVSDAYRLMHELGCKGGTVYRDGCRDEQVLRKVERVSVYVNGTATPASPARRLLPDRRQSVTQKFHVGDVRGFFTVGLYADGAPGELFVRFSKTGSTIAGLLDSWAMSVSLSLQYGTPLASVVRLFSGVRFEPSGLTHDAGIPVCSSIPDYVVRWLDREFGVAADRGHDSAVMSGQLCPDCQSELVLQAGCLSCVRQGCGWQRCG